MIIIASKEGQFANRVIHFANIYAFCKTHNIRLIHPYFHPYKSYFKNLQTEKQVTMISNSKFTQRILAIIEKLFRVLHRHKLYNLGFIESIVYTNTAQGYPIFDLNTPQIIKKAKRKILLLHGWLFRDYTNFRLQEKRIRYLFDLSHAFETEAKNIITEINKIYSVIIGVHIRRGDYKTFEGGKWYYNDEVYKDKMIFLADQFAQNNQTVAFIICSNESINKVNFTSLPVFSFKKDFIIDMLLLSKSDYIIGPPSTFSAYASFWGKKPLQHIVNKNETMHLKNFNVLTTL